LSTKTFTSDLTENALLPGWSVTETTYMDNSNAAYGTGTQLAMATAPPAFAKTGLLAAVSPLSSPYSLTQEYKITWTGEGSALSTEKISSAVPEPSTWAMMAIGMAGLGLAGMGRRSKDRLAPGLG
jgi:hypothetical protein